MPRKATKKHTTIRIRNSLWSGLVAAASRDGCTVISLIERFVESGLVDLDKRRAAETRRAQAAREREQASNVFG